MAPYGGSGFHQDKVFIVPMLSGYGGPKRYRHWRVRSTSCVEKHWCDSSNRNIVIEDRHRSLGAYIIVVW